MGEKGEVEYSQYYCDKFSQRQMITRLSGVITTVRYKNVTSLYCTPETNITDIILYANILNF